MTPISRTTLGRCAKSSLQNFRSVRKAETVKTKRLPIERFMAKCRVDGLCIVWTGATYPSGDKRSPGFWFNGKRWPARRWYAVHVHGREVHDSDNVEQGCSNPLCVRHSKVITGMPGRNYQRQAYLLNELFPEGW